MDHRCTSSLNLVKFGFHKNLSVYCLFLIYLLSLKHSIEIRSQSERKPGITAGRTCINKFKRQQRIVNFLH